RTHADTPEARQCIQYIVGNRHRMRYPQFRARGLCVSSGVVEAGCKQIGARLKRAGMRWTVAGANAILALRCCILSGRFEDFWERRAAKAA
ncbi:MAG: ISKra4 family transposase, partial [Acidobacteria bacterium]|nr:ISKra4 family transposase [Acidobacteriota bacterium]